MNSLTAAPDPKYPEAELTKYAAFVFKRSCKKTVHFHCPNGELRSKSTAAKLRQMGVRPGVADFILLCRGQSIAVEIKTLTGVQSGYQIGFQTAWEAQGGVYVIVRTPEEIDGLIFKFGLD